MPLRTTFHPQVNRLTIQLPVRFTFDSHADFRPAYRDQPAGNRKYRLDFRDTEYLDSAGLGMLLQLLDYVGGDRKRIELVNLQPNVRELLHLADIDSLMTVQPGSNGEREVLPTRS
jgi:HptB-dependent secretion and biofilm anti anti-sigma factor